MWNIAPGLSSESNYVSAKSSTESSKKETSRVSVEDAQLIAYKFIKESSNTENEAVWNENTSISKHKEIYNIDETVYAYLFYLENYGDSVGYIVVSADRANIPIIEFSDLEEVFFDTILEDVENDAEERKAKAQINQEFNEDYLIKKADRIYNIGDYQYAIKVTFDENDNYIYDMSGKSISNLEAYAKLNVDDETEQLKDEVWEYYTNDEVYDEIQKKRSVGINNTLENRAIITNPDLGEVSTPTKYKVPNYSLSYKIMDNYKSIGYDHCASVAVVNLFMYYYNCNKTTYSPLFRGTWTNTFQFAYDYMGPNAFIPRVRQYLNTMFSENNISLKVDTYLGTSSGQKIVDHMKKYKTPGIVLVNDHPNYNNHYMLALGYQSYPYSTGNSNYILVADAKIRTASRYIWGGESGTWYYLGTRK